MDPPSPADPKFLLPIPVKNPDYGAAARSNFKLPPLNCSLTLPELYDWHLENNMRQTVFIFESQPSGYTHLSYAEVVPACNRAARYVAGELGLNIQEINTDMPPVAVMATSDTVTHFCTLVGMLKAGIPCFAISPHNSPDSLAYILKAKNISHAFLSQEDSRLTLAEHALRILQAEAGTRTLNISAMPKYEDLFFRGHSEPLPSRIYDLDLPVLYTHSSGTTSKPKLVPWTHRFFLQCGVAPLFGDYNLCNEVLAYHSASLSRGTGIHLLAWIPISGLKLGVFPPAATGRFPSPEATFDAFSNLKADFLITYPSLIETWSYDQRKVHCLRDAKAIVFVGSPLNKVIGDSLVEQGVNLYTFYGMTEGGVISSIFPVKQGKDWQYFSPTPHSGAEFVHVYDDLYELYIVRRTFKHAPFINAKYEGSDAFASRDLCVPHPQKAGFWRVVGRMDDLLIHANGEKTNPLPLEHIMSSHPYVHAALVFGNEKLWNGVLVQLRAEFAFNPNELEKLRAFREDFRQVLQDANSIAPSHSQIFPEMVLIADPQKPFALTDKASVKRGLTLSLYRREIEDLYERSEHTIHSDIALPVDWSFAHSLAFCRSAIDTILHGIGQDDDLFHRGFDSLQTTRLENIIRHALKQTIGVSTGTKLLKDFIYRYPTPTTLAHFVSRVAHGQAQVSDTLGGTCTMDALVTQYEAQIGNHSRGIRLQNGFRKEARSTVLLTGSTGHVGANLLTQLVANGQVDHIFVLLRGFSSGDDVELLVKKQEEALRHRGLDPACATSDKVSLLRCALEEANCGLDRTSFNHITETTTHIFHLAWAVNWNLSLASLEELVAGTVNLVNLALASRLDSPPRVIFASSIGVFRNVDPGQRVLETHLGDFHIASGQGYSESKAVSEALLASAAKRTTLRPVIARFGQVSGGLNGSWNLREWFPSLVKSSVALGFMPDIKGFISWLPANVVSQALLEARDTESPIIHISHPRPVEFSAILRTMSEALYLPLVPYDQWVRQLQDLAGDCTVEDLERVPALKILGFFQDGDVVAPRADMECLGLPMLDTTEASKSCPSLREVDRTGEEEALRWLEYWKGAGLL